ncbi:cytochrome c-552 [Oceaniovalibus guishaninsula JLT2003]|uniref:Cytochrome c-552 n=1 Tax=Oceaniovalibus guishaninsula JLT2003 TaxID=1231392 RepID=K2H8I5_9RHOB|nr:hypothetical protein [Oceaniovalibus guishaninsula]EKE43903.1 cytochrome c-552 [Oceaniovalibus guishaninsula JLT2003]
MTQIRAAALAAPVLLSLTAMQGAAQQGYDPMRPTANPLMPGALAGEPSEAAAPNPDFGNLPDGPGVEETYYQCVACHSTAIIRQQHLTDERWDYLWTWMVEKQGMYEPDDETRDIVLSYLKTHFSAER